MSKTTNSTGKPLQRGPGMRGGHGHNFDTAGDFRKTFARLFRYLGKEKFLFITGTVFILVNVLLTTTAPAIMGKAVTMHLEKVPDPEAFASEMLKLLVIYISAFGASAVNGFCWSIMSNRVLFRMRKEGFDHIQRLSISYFDRKGKGDIISRMTNDIDTVFNFLSNGFMSTMSAFFTLAGVLVAMISLNIPLTIAVLATLPIAGFVMMLIGKKVRTAAKEKQKQTGLLTAAIEESVSGMKVIQSFHRESEEFSKFEKVNNNAKAASIKMESTSYTMMPLLQLVNVTGLVFIIGLGGALTILKPGIYSIGLLTSFIVYARKFFDPLRQIANVYNLFQSAVAGAERIFEVFDSSEEIPEAPEPATAGKLEDRIEFRNVSFRYEDSKPVLESISFTAERGTSTAIVGPTGAGKTTIINLLARFYDVKSGEILIDGRDLRDFSKNSIRSQLGIVLQEPFFFADTIKNNLLYAKPGATEEQLLSAAETANAHHFISCLPDGYDTALTERGLNLSQGERQLLAITRAVLADPDILVLDEATSSIDSLTEKHIRTGLDRLMQGRTSFIVAHRLSTIKNADNIIVVHNHRIVESGTHKTLMEARGFYHRLYSVQFKKAELTEEMVSGDSTFTGL